MDQSYESLQAILEEAGLYHREKAEFNDIDSKLIVMSDQFLADTNHDDTVDNKDVLVLVDGAVVEVVEVDVKTSIITLKNKVNSGQLVRVKYAFTSVEQEFVEKVREEAIAEIQTKIPCLASVEVKHKPIIRCIVRLLSAGKLLIRDYGFNEDVENTSKDGYKKIELAHQKINEFVELVCRVEGNIGQFAGQDDGDLFPRKPRASSEEW